MKVNASKKLYLSSTGKLGDGCNALTTGDCIAKQNTLQAFSITHDDMVEMYDRRREELMKLSKEDLVELIIGKRDYVGMTFG